MKILVVNKLLEQKHIEQIKEKTKNLGADVLFYGAEDEIPESDFDAEIIYGVAPKIVNSSKTLKWVCSPLAGVDLFMKPGFFANEDCLLTNSAGAYGVSIAEHMVAVSLMLLRKLNEFFDETRDGKWLQPRAQKSLKDCRVTVLGTGDIGTTFAKRVRAFEPKRIVGVCRSGKSAETVYDRVLPVGKLDTVLPETDILAMTGTYLYSGFYQKHSVNLLCVLLKILSLLKNFAIYFISRNWWISIVIKQHH